MDIRRTIADLRARVAAIGAHREALREKRRPHALAGVLGDASATRAMKEFDTKSARLDREAMTLEDALVQAEQLEIEAAQKAHDEDWARRSAEADRISEELLEVSQLADTLLFELAATLARRRELATALQDTGCVSSGLKNRFWSQGSVARAFRSANLFKHCGNPPAPGACTLFNHDEAIAKSRIERPPFRQAPAGGPLAQALPQLLEDHRTPTGQ